MALIAYDVALEMIAAIGPVIREVARRDRSLADQMRRCASSVPLNINEGAHSSKGNETARYHNAAGSASETRAALKVAAAWGYVSPDRCAPIDALLDRLLGLLWGLTHRGRRS